MSNRHVELTRAIIGAAMDVHSELGPGLLESAYEACLQFELIRRGLSVARQVSVPIVYRGRERVENAFLSDLLVQDCCIVEVRAVTSVLPIHEARLLTYMKRMKRPVGLILDFNNHRLSDGITRPVL